MLVVSNATTYFMDKTKITEYHSQESFILKAANVTLVKGDKKEECNTRNIIYIEQNPLDNVLAFDLDGKAITVSEGVWFGIL